MKTMARLRSKAYLTCFYCGRRTSTPNDGSVRRFECPACEATNYLDENGEITDPPLEATAPSRGIDERPATIGSLTSSQQDSDVFCATCLKNQRLFTSSLAQYLPEDPDDPEYEIRERNFYRFRKNLEMQYPQTCARCEPKVLERIAQAGYTAKTDHLRRMLDRSLQARTAEQAKARGPLRLFSVLGRYMWFAGFILQGIWHLEMLQGFVVSTDLPLLKTLGIKQLLGILASVLSRLPEPERLMKWSILSTATSLWWNPFFVKTVRGFTNHLLGIGTWYTYQAVIMFLRVLAPGIPKVSRERGTTVSVQLMMHSLALVAMFCIAKLALGSMRVDTTLLFGGKMATASKSQEGLGSPVKSEERGRTGNALFDTLDEVLLSPVPARESDNEEINSPSPSPRIRPRYTEGPLRGQQISQRGGLFAPENARGSGFGRRDDILQNTSYDSEMDWQPTGPTSRAFNSFGAPEQALRSFNDAPADDKHGPFWFRVPPAPATSMVQRAALTPSSVSGTARLRKQPEPQPQRQFFVRKSSGELRKEQEAREIKEKELEEEKKYFKSPKFVHRATDPRDPLSDMFGGTFNISPGHGAVQQTVQANVTPKQGVVTPHQINPSDIPVLVLSALLLVPGHDKFVPEEYGVHVALSVCCISLIIWVRVLLESFKGRRSSGILGAVVAAAIGVSEFCVIAWAALTSQGSGKRSVLVEFSGQAKTIFLCLLVVHQVWNVFIVPLLARTRQSGQHGASMNMIDAT